MYGYRLTDDDCPGPNVYYHVSFGVGSTVFTYPEWTVREVEGDGASVPDPVEYFCMPILRSISQLL